MMRKEQFKIIPSYKLTEIPKDVDFIQIYRDRYWVSDDNDNLYFNKKSLSPMCNTNKKIVDRLVETQDIFTHVIFEKEVYVEFDPSDWGY